MKGWLKYLLFLAVILAMVVWLGGFLDKKEKPAEVSRPAKVVSGLEFGQVKKVEVLDAPYAGQVVADKRVELSTRVMGKIVGLYVKEGQRVSPGQLLVSVDAQDIQAQVSAVEHQIKQAEQALASANAHYEAVRKTFERYSQLLKEGAVTPQEFDQI
ncbi:MAG: biotin/lipoyl-binding protein, partial [Aquificaceae bacterium]|nr:biotin/lipoyl-binding protein [Aquificaceae bacterium]